MIKVSNDAFIAAWKRCGSSPQRVAQALSLTVRAVYERRQRLADRGIVLATVDPRGGQRFTDWSVEGHAYTPRVNETVKDGWVLIGSDCHYWPGLIPLAHEAFCTVSKRIRPKLIILNGDVFDGANISRHEPMGWQKLPTVIEELDTVKLRLEEISRAAPNAKKLMTVGNHDSRFDRRLATETMQFEGVPGFRLQDHFKDWPMSYSVLLNESIDPTFILHNIRGGTHAPFNNIKAAGCTVITGHLHSQKTMPFSTMLHDWEGIDAGCIADRDGPQFSYRMDRPSDWRSGFVALHFDRDGHRYPAELCRIQHIKGAQRAVFLGDVVASR